MLFLAAVWLAGCASTPRGLVLEPVGPAPAGAVGGSGPGSLMVFSALDTAPDFNQSPYRQRYTDYRIYPAEGNHLLKAVHNDSGKLIDGPVRVELPAGNYHVSAKANGYGQVTVPVVIKAGQTTAVHLEGSHWWPRGSAIFDADPVRLPGGQIVGWPAVASRDP